MTNAHEAIRTRFNERAPHYDESDMHRAVAAAVAAFVSLTNVETVLDVATGTGLVLRSILDRQLIPNLVGIDLSPGMLAVAKRELPSATFHMADAAALPLPDASVDLVTCVTALHIIPDTAAAIREWRRVLKPGGRAVTATFGESDRGTRSRHPYPVDHASFASPEALAQTVAPLGFRITRHEIRHHGPDRLLIAELAPKEETP